VNSLLKARINFHASFSIKAYDLILLLKLKGNHFIKVLAATKTSSYSILGYAKKISSLKHSTPTTKFQHFPSKSTIKIF